jgi:hypothetical protein
MRKTTPVLAIVVGLTAGVMTPLTILHTRLPPLRASRSFALIEPRIGIHPKDYDKLVSVDFDPLDQGADNLALCVEFNRSQLVVHGRRKFFEAVYH